MNNNMRHLHLFSHHLLLFIFWLLLIINNNSSLCCYASSVEAFFGNGQALELGMEFEAIYQFGDSLSDTGNFIRERAGMRSVYKRFPYGQTYHHPTGRASDGLLMIDFIAMFFRVPFLNPYFATRSDFTHGVNFAVIGATANGRRNSLAQQIAWFKSHLHSTFSGDPIAIREKLQKSLVMMGEIGGNDFNGPFYQGKTIPQVARLIPGVVKTIKRAIEEVINLGANNIVVPGNFPIGCVPLYLSRFATNDTSKYDDLHCLKDYNTFSRFYNQQLLVAIKQLQLQYPHVAIVYADYYSALIAVITYAPYLGIERDGTEKACCGIGNNPYNYGTLGCGSRGSPVCNDPSRRLSWDGVHMTEHGNRCVAAFLINQFLPPLQKHAARRHHHRRHH